MSETVEITRYPNRRLYDRNSKQYVTLGEIEAMVLGGQDVRVCDSKSNQDLTRVILIQIIVERHPERVRMFPPPFLHALLRADQMALNWLSIYFGQATKMMEAFTSGSPDRSVIPGMDFWQSFMPAVSMSGATEPPSSESEPPQGQEPEPDADTKPEAQNHMAQRLAEMERRLKQLEGNSPTDDQ